MNRGYQLHRSTTTFSKLKELLKTRLQPNHQLWFRLPDRSWSEVTSDATLPWNRLHAGINVYTIVVRADSPPTSPEKEPGKSRSDVLLGPAGSRPRPCSH